MEIRYTIKDVMATDLITFKPDTPIESAIKSFLENKISGAPVVNEQGDLIGMLSEKDCLGTLFESSYYNNPSGYVKDYMSTELSTIICAYYSYAHSYNFNLSSRGGHLSFQGLADSKFLHALRTIESSKCRPTT